MRALVQRVKTATVTVNGALRGQIGIGLVVFLGVSPTDTDEQALWLSQKISRLRAFDDETGKMQRDLSEVGGSLLVVSQFTLYAEVRRGRRPDFTKAAPSGYAEPLYNKFVTACRTWVPQVQTGACGADMDVSLTNWGPVTLWIETP
ncbi:MAG: D-aminoacyl-tRNA deacylase [Sulfobacillus sp.]